MKAYLKQILITSLLFGCITVSAQTTLRAALKLNSPITFFSLATNPTVNGQCGVELALNKGFIGQFNLQIGQVSNFKSSVVGKAGNFKNEFSLIGFAAGYDVFRFNRRLTRKGHQLYLTTGFYYMPSRIKYFKTDESIREINITFWLNNFGAEYRYHLSPSIDLCVFTDVFISQSAWIDGYPKGDSFDHFMNMGAGINFKLTKSKIKGLKIR